MRKAPKNQTGDKLEVVRQNEQLKTLLDISHSLRQHLNVDDLILHIIKRITEVMEAETASVILHDERRNGLLVRWTSDTPGRAKTLGETLIPVDQGIAGCVFRTGKAEVILDVARDPRHYKQVDHATRFTTNSMIAVPLKTNERTVGVFQVMNKQRGIFTQEDLQFAVLLAPLLAMALENARMYTELEGAYKELQAIDESKDTLLEQTTHEVALLRREVERHYRFEQITGHSETMREVFRLCERIIDSEISVLIEGETGTGKELIARTIHYHGPRKHKPFTAQNCGGIPDTLLASELFGHRRGAFTGAVRDKKGLFDIADGGTVFLDEVGDMSLAMQTSLLRVLQEGEIKPLGSDSSKTVDIRLISATNKNLREEVRQGRFREDLFYRLSVFTIALPPLRERVGDIPLLANQFVRKIGNKTKKSIRGISREAMECLATYPFPGNVRELENEIERAVAMVEGGETIEVCHLSDKVRETLPKESFKGRPQGSLKDRVETLERSILSETLEKHRDNKTKAAKELGLSRYGLMKKMQRYGFLILLANHLVTRPIP